MFKVMRQKDLIKLVESYGFTLVRNGEHKVFELVTIDLGLKQVTTISIPHSKTISSGLVHQTYKTLKTLKGTL